MSVINHILITFKQFRAEQVDQHPETTSQKIIHLFRRQDFNHSFQTDNQYSSTGDRRHGRDSFYPAGASRREVTLSSAINGPRLNWSKTTLEPFRYQTVFGIVSIVETPIFWFFRLKRT
jgi:hypothetical protein